MDEGFSESCVIHQSVLFHKFVLIILHRNYSGESRLLCQLFHFCSSVLSFAHNRTLSCCVLLACSLSVFRIVVSLMWFVRVKIFLHQWLSEVIYDWRQNNKLSLTALESLTLSLKKNCNKTGFAFNRMKIMAACKQKNTMHSVRTLWKSNMKARNNVRYGEQYKQFK